MEGMKLPIILFRHGRRMINLCEKPDDGPLKPEYTHEIVSASRQLAKELSEKGVLKIDYVAVSGSIRCAETFAHVWRTLAEEGVSIGIYDMRQEFFFTPEEDEIIKGMYSNKREEFEEMRKKHGEVYTYTHLARTAVIPSAVRTVSALINQIMEGTKTVMAVTHSPHDVLIEKVICGVRKTKREPIQQGTARVLWT